MGIFFLFFEEENETKMMMLLESEISALAYSPMGFINPIFVRFDSCDMSSVGKMNDVG